jgi:hypothetical protein
VLRLARLEGSQSERFVKGCEVKLFHCDARLPEFRLVSIEVIQHRQGWPTIKNGMHRPIQTERQRGKLSEFFTLKELPYFYENVDDLPLSRDDLFELYFNTALGCAKFKPVRYSQPST